MLQSRACIAPSGLGSRRCQAVMQTRRDRRTTIRRTATVQVAAVAAPHAAASQAAAAPPQHAQPAQQHERDPAQESFKFEEQWWPCAVLATYDKSRPHALELLGKKLVLWYDAPAATWRAGDDVCPHRLAPLSEGRVESNGHIECAYHGWRFEGSKGACTRIPQAEDDTRACARCRVRTYPTREGAGLLFVWPTAYDDARAAAAPLPLTQAVLDHVAAGGQINWYRRLLPYGWDVLLENLADPSHLPFSHHGLAGLNREKALAMPFTPIDIPVPGADAAGDGGAAPAAGGAEAGGLKGGRPPCVFPHAQPVGLFRYPTVSGQGSLALVAVNAPCSVSYFSRLSAITLSSELMAVPAGPGRSMAFTGNIIKARPSANPIMRLLLSLYHPPAWRNCINYNKLFDQDSPFLTAQDATLRKLGGGRAWAKSYYMPVTCDRLIVALRAWIDVQAGGGPSYGPTTDPPPQQLTRRQINDRWSQHTRECTACQAAAAGLKRQAVAFAAAAVALVAALSGAAASTGLPRLLAGGAPSALTLVAVGGAALAAALAWRAWRMLPQFDYVEYTAADNH